MKILRQLSLVLITSTIMLQSAICATNARLLPFKAEIVTEGVFNLREKAVTENAPNTAAGKVGEIQSIELVKSTSRLRAVQGVTFGFQYRVIGVVDGDNSGFEMRALHPPMKSHTGRLETTSTAETYIFGTRGIATNNIVYTLTEPTEVLPGKWTLQLLYRGQVVLSRDFFLEE